MSLSGKLESAVEVEAPASAVHHIFSCTTHQLPNFIPGKIQSVDIVQGQWGTVGSIIRWKFIHEGLTMTSMELIEAIDFNNCTTTYKVLEGDLLNHYKSFKFLLKVTPTKQGSSVGWTLEYEKHNEGVPDPKTILELADECSKGVADNLVQQQN